MTPTLEQDAILSADRAGGNLMINALAGTGKSATLKLLDRAHRKAEARLYLVFNKRNQLEALEAQKADEFSSLTAIKTFNGLGHGIWTKVVGQVTLDKAKSRTIWRQMTDDMTRGEASAAWRHYSVVMDGIEKAKAHGYVPRSCKLPHTALIDAESLALAMDERPTPDAMELIDALLNRSIVQAYSGIIDFNDQIYMPALFEGTYPKFPRIMVDEYQDQSPVNHALLARLVRGRPIGVGDPDQNIYGFRGAKSGGMSAAVEQYSMTELPLSVSFRCPSAIVEAARWRVPEFKWSREGGSVHDARYFHVEDIPQDATFICRNNAPLLDIAFRLTKAGKPTSVVGGEMGPRIISIMKKFGSEMMTQAEVLTKIDEWEQEKLEAESKSASDLADCMRVLAEHGDRLSTMLSYAEHMYKQQGTIQLLTIHKFKGLEFNNVFLLDEHLMDTREQDLNLRYVAITRSQNSLTKLDSSAILW